MGVSYLLPAWPKVWQFQPFAPKSHSDSAKKEEVEERPRTDIAMDILTSAHANDNRVDE